MKLYPELLSNNLRFAGLFGGIAEPRPGDFKGLRGGTRFIGDLRSSFLRWISAATSRKVSAKSRMSSFDFCLVCFLQTHDFERIRRGGAAFRGDEGITTKHSINLISVTRNALERMEGRKSYNSEEKSIKMSKFVKNNNVGGSGTVLLNNESKFLNWFVFSQLNH